MAEDKTKEVKPEPEKTEEPEKIKLGDEEFTKEDLQKLVGLGRIAQEAEEKYDRPIAKYWPEYTKTKQQLAEIEEERKAEAEARVKEEEQRVATLPREQLSEEQVRELAIKQADDLGLYHKGNLRNEVLRIVGDYEYARDIEGMLKDAKAEGYPSTSLEEFTSFMNERRIYDLDVAYETMFKDQLAALEKGKLEEIKTEGLKTQEGSTAGSKTPPQPPPLRKDALQDALKSHFASKEGREG